MVYDITDPTNPQFSEYERSTTNYPASTGDIAPEGLAFVPAGNSPNGNALLLVANELSGTTRVMQINCAPETAVPEVPLAALLPLSMLAVGGVWAWRRQGAS